MTARVGYVLGALLLGVGALVGVQYSGATFTDDSSSSAQVTAAADWAAPSVVVSALEPGIFGTVTVTATATDDRSDIGQVTLEYSLPGSSTWVPLTAGCTTSSGPSPLSYSCQWDTTTVSDGDYEVRATATDTAAPIAFTGVSTSVPTQVANNASVVLTTVPSPIQGVVTLTGTLLNAGNGSRTISFEYAPADSNSWQNATGCSVGNTSDYTCSFDTSALSGLYDVRAVGTRGGSTFYDEQSGIVVDNTAPTVTVDKAVGQADPTVDATINFTVVFSEPVSGFDSQDVTIGGTSPGAKTATVSGTGPVHNVAVTGMTGNGSVMLSVPAAAATDAVGHASEASTSTDNSVGYDAGGLTSVTIEQAVVQSDPTQATSMTFDVVFSKPVTGFAAADVSITGTASGTKTVGVTGSGATYTVTVSGVSGSGTVIATIVAGAAIDGYGNATLASSSVDNSVTRDVVAPSVTINQAAGQADPASATTINFTVIFSEPVSGFETGDVAISGTATGTKLGTVTGSGSTYNVAVTGMSSEGTVIATILAARARDLAGNDNLASASTDNTVTRDITAPTVSVVRATGTTANSTATTLNFTVTFGEPVANFQTGDVSFSGTSLGNLVGTVTGGGATYNVAVTGMATDGTVVVNVAAAVATDSAGNGNLATTSGANGRTVNWDNQLAPSVTVNQAAGQADPTNASSMSFAVEFSEPVAGLAAGDFTGSNLGGSRTLTGNGSSYVLTISGMTQQGTVTLSLGSSKAKDLSGTNNTVSTSTDNTVIRDSVGPTVTVSRAAGQADPGNGSQVNFAIVFNEAVTGFDANDVTTASSTAGGTKTVTVTGSGTTYNVWVAGMTTPGSVIVSFAAGSASDVAGNGNAAPTIIDNSVAWSP